MPCVISVTFLPPALRCPGSTNVLQVMDEIQATSSGRSTSGFRFGFTTRLPAATLWQVLNPSSVIGNVADEAAGPGGGAGGAATGGATTGGATTGGRTPPSCGTMRAHPPSWGAPPSAFCS